MSQHEAPALDPEVVLEFLVNTLPFSELEDEVLADLSRQITIDFYPKGTRIFVQDETRVDHLYLVQKGGVRLYIRDEKGDETLIDYRGEGSSLGAPAIFRDSAANLDAETVEDTFFFLLPKQDFQGLIKQYPSIAHYYLKTFSDSYLSKAFAELRHRSEGALSSDDSGLFLFSYRVGDMVHREPVTMTMGMTIQDAALRMVQQGVGSLLVEDPSGDTVGIVTDKDLRKAVSVGMDHDAPIETIMSYPVTTVEGHELCFDALLKMMTRHIHHLAVMRDGQVAGMVTSHDIMVLQGKSPISLFREIASQQSIEGLYPLSKRVPQVVRTLVDEGAKAGNITRMITVLNDLLLEKILTLLLRQLGRPPAPFCWLLMGSEGRREQTFMTDQDNALVYKDYQDDVLQRACHIYFSAFAERAIDHLIKCGFPPCPGDIMARNPKWCQPFSVWRQYFEKWVDVPEPEEVMHAAIFFDFRGGFGDMNYADSLREHVARHASRSDVFLRLLAANCLETRPPLSFFRNFIVEKNGEHKNTLDIKKRGLAPVVDFARVMALKHNIKETNTMSRLEKLAQGGHINEEMYKDASESYEFLMQIRLVHQLECTEQGLEPNNRIDPGKLSDLEKRTLKEAFGVIGKLQSYLKDAFRLNI